MFCNSCDFYTSTEKEIVYFSEEDVTEFYDGTIKFSGQEVLVMNVKAIIEKVGKEIEAA